MNFNYDVFPSTRLEASYLTTPLAFIHTPFATTSQVSCNPLRCECGNYINPYIKLDRKNWMWWCPFCETRTPLPVGYPVPVNAHEEEDWPVELRQSVSTVDYCLPEDLATQVQPDLPNAYVLIIDRYAYPNDPGFSHLKSALCDFIDKVSGYVMLIEYDDSVSVYQEGNRITDKFEGMMNAANEQIFSKKTTEMVLSRFGLERHLPFDREMSPLVQNGFLREVESSRQELKQIINSITPVLTDTSRAPRVSGTAHYVTSVLLSHCSYRNFIGKTIHFASGACSKGPGKIFTKEMVRSHKDIVDLNAPNFLPARKFYDALAKVANGTQLEDAYKLSQSTTGKTTHNYTKEDAPIWTVSLITGSSDQVGCYEMKPMISGTMGSIQLIEAFDKLSLPIAIDKCLVGKFKNRIRITTSSKLKISRMVGGGFALPSSYKNSEVYSSKIADTVDKFDNSISKKEFTNQWQFNCLGDSDSLCFLLEMETVRSSKELSIAPEEVFIQVAHRYYQGGWKLRVTTVRKKTTKGAGYQEGKVGLSLGFNQHVYIDVLARLLINKIDTTLGFEPFDNLVKLLDSTVADLLKNFGGIRVSPYSKEYEVQGSFEDIPRLAYNLRRSPMIRIFNSSPDETAMIHSWFQVMSVQQGLRVIMPHLYRIGEKTVEIPLDSTSLVTSEPLLIMDGVFQRVIYATSPLKLHHSDNSNMVLERNEVIRPALEFLEKQECRLAPKYVVTCVGHSQARYLLARLNPVDKLQEESKGIWKFFRRWEYDGVMTDDIGLNGYCEGLKKMGESS